MFSANTVDTTRIWGDHDLAVMINSLQMAYPGFPRTTVSWKPNALVLTPITAFPFAFTASSLVHHPNNAPIMLVPERLTEELTNEILRLHPEGKDVPAQVFLIGPVSETIERQVRNLGLSTVRIGSQNPYETSVAVSNYRLTYPPMSEQGKNNLFLLSGETFAESMFAPNYAMHEGLPILLTKRTELSPIVLQFLTEHQRMNAYLVGSESTISLEVEALVRRTIRGNVVRITGNSPYENSVNFSRFFDPQTEVGWNRNQPGRGDAFSFVTASDWRTAIFSGLFSHLGKHAPLLLTEYDQLPRVVLSYLQHLNPHRSGSTQPPYMHGYVFGNFDALSYQTQVNIEEAIILREH
ncbi:cell wall-binding repeat-containing protein [Brevibacillus laterosporus]|uniref:Cell wall-binding repeat-containing protein n=1 Tax=Brevibacillus laterosporus TaxID=1465 RepID=A0A518VAQ2_BRELA|nr:cell wall-binding repeat-containing protein [Brevibacillus laterosporus]